MTRTDEFRPKTAPATLFPLPRIIWLLLILAALLIGRAAVSQNDNLVILHDYAHLHERAPFQNRLLMAPVLRAAETSHLFLRIHHALFAKTVDHPLDLVIMLTNCAALLLLLPITVALRRCFAPEAQTAWLAPLLMLLIVAFTFVVRYEQRFSMPYDFLSMLFFNLGLLAILRRQPILLLLLLAVAVPNRETAVFLIPVWFWLEWREGRRTSAVVFSLVGLVIFAAWQIAIKRILHTPAAPYDLPWRNNLISLVLPVHWPQLVSIFGFLAWPVWHFRHYLTDPRLRALWISTIPFLAIAIIVGIWRESRIFGELSGLAALTFAIQLERLLQVRQPLDGAYLPPMENG